MSLTGCHARSLDDKLRVAIPKPIRDQLGSDVTHLVIAPGLNGSLDVFPPAEFHRLSQLISEKSLDVRKYERMLFGRSEKVELDSQGRIRIPERLAALAGLSRDVVLLGVRNHVELWDADRWRKFEEENAAEFDALALKALSRTEEAKPNG
jgi:MraZ protein